MATAPSPTSRTNTAVTGVCADVALSGDEPERGALAAIAASAAATVTAAAVRATDIQPRRLGSLLSLIAPVKP
jgi:hypothetical protein